MLASEFRPVAMAAISMATNPAITGKSVINSTPLRSNGFRSAQIRRTVQPIIFYFVHRLFEKPSLKWSAALAASLSLSFFGGFPQYFYYVAAIAVIYSFLLALFSTPNYSFKGGVLRGGSTPKYIRKVRMRGRYRDCHPRTEAFVAFWQGCLMSRPRRLDFSRQFRYSKTRFLANID